MSKFYRVLYKEAVLGVFEDKDKAAALINRIKKYNGWTYSHGLKIEEDSFDD